MDVGWFVDKVVYVDICCWEVVVGFVFLIFLECIWMIWLYCFVSVRLCVISIRVVFWVCWVLNISFIICVLVFLLRLFVGLLVIRILG